MALQTGIGASRILILVGAGVGGSIVLRNGKISDLLSDLSRVLSKHLKENEEGSSSGGDGGVMEAMQAQVRKLSNEIKQLASANRTITVNTGGGSSAVASLGSLFLPVTVIGLAGWGYMWLRGWSFSDIMYVTKRNMNNAVASMGKQLDSVSSALGATKRQLTSRLDFMSRSLEDNTAITSAIQGQIGAVFGEVGEVRGEVAQIGLDMRDVNKHIEGLEGKVGEMAQKQDLANHGISLLCRFVMEGMEGSQKPELLQSFQGFHAYSRARLERSSSIPYLTSSPGLKDLQNFSDKLLLGTGQSPVELTSNHSSPNLQRSLTTNGHAFLRSATKAT